jgi:hypothetical protein
LYYRWPKVNVICTVDIHTYTHQQSMSKIVSKIDRKKDNVRNNTSRSLRVDGYLFIGGLWFGFEGVWHTPFNSCSAK